MFTIHFLMFYSLCGDIWSPLCRLNLHTYTHTHCESQDYCNLMRPSDVIVRLAGGHDVSLYPNAAVWQEEVASVQFHYSTPRLIWECDRMRERKRE